MATGAVAIYTIYNHNYNIHPSLYIYQCMCYVLPDVWCHWFPAVHALEDILHQHVIAQTDLVQIQNFKYSNSDSKFHRRWRLYL